MLTVRQRRFAEEYLVCGEGKAAAIAAGYSSRSAKQTACKLLAHPEVSAAIADGLARLTDRAERKVEEYLKRVDLIAFASPGGMWTGQEILKAAELGMRARKMLTDKLETNLGVTFESLVPKRRGVLGPPLEHLVPPRKPSAETIDVTPAAELPALPPLEQIVPKREPSEPEPPSDRPAFAKTEIDHDAVLKHLRS